MNPQPAARPGPLQPDAVDALLLDTTPYLSCEECFERMDGHVEALLRNDPPDPALSRHLQGCAACHEEARSLAALLSKDGARPTPAG
ncbi:hypothetical protein [Pedococcus sp. 2YAF34]|uniref:hypothetical protein n=1 Tax=Pedococcus sp. 2YAF34 TaxID=3233032 RepID=UPI003F9B6B44